MKNFKYDTGTDNVPFLKYKKSVKYIFVKKKKLLILHSQCFMY